MIISFDVPSQKATRIGDSMSHIGYVYNPELGTTDAQQKMTFLKSKTIAFWREIVHNSEVDNAKRLAEQGVIVDFSDII